MSEGMATVSYIGATILFILSLGGLSNPETSRRGNFFGIAGMLIAVTATILGAVTANYASLFGGLLVGGGIGFVLACFVGYMVVWNVTPSLHTPLMSVTNAISSIIIIGALLQVSSDSPAVTWIARVTILLTSINIAGGFAVTHRMLAMFRK